MAGAALALLAGCGGGDQSLPVATAPLQEGVEVDPQVYLSDSAAAAQAVRDFSAALEGLGPVVRPAALRQAAPALAEAQQRAARAASRLSAQRLADARLEGQRGTVSGPLERVVEAMAAVVAVAGLGDAPGAVGPIADFATAVEELRTLPG